MMRIARISCHGAPLAGDYWLDQTSRLYYRRISPAQYRESLNAFFGAGNDGTIDCLVNNLPPV